jgi:hypothetical protein
MRQKEEKWMSNRIRTRSHQNESTIVAMWASHEVALN